MLAKKLTVIGLLLFVVGVFMAGSLGLAQAAERPGPSNNPPECYPINYLVEGYWGMACIDNENNISSVSLKTNGFSNLSWDNTYVEMIVEVGPNTYIVWQVCDTNGACVDGRYQ